jgi:P pilus assembly chaperone PapD
MIIPTLVRFSLRNIVSHLSPLASTSLCYLVAMCFFVSVTSEHCSAETTPQDAIQNIVLHEQKDLSIVLRREGSMRSIQIQSSVINDKTAAAHFILREPSRLVVDIPNLTVGSGKSISISDEKALSRIRLGQQPDKGRVVLDLATDEEPHYTIQAHTGTITLVLGAEHDTDVALSQPKSAPLDLPLKAEKPDSREEASAADHAVPALAIPQSKLKDEGLLRFSLDKVNVSFDADSRPIQNVTLKNRSTTTLYINATAEEVVAAGSPDEEQRSTTALLVSPRRVEVPAGEERSFRLVLTKQLPNQEQVFRINFIPLPDGFEDKVIPATFNGSSARLQVVAGLAITVVSSPKNIQGDLSWDRKDDSVVFHNESNITVSLDGGKVCAQSPGVATATHEKSCTSLPVKKLYPGNTWTLTLPSVSKKRASDDGYIEFMKKTGAEYILLRIPISS